MKGDGPATWRTWSGGATVRLYGLVTREPYTPEDQAALDATYRLGGKSAIARLLTTWRRSKGLEFDRAEVKGQYAGEVVCFGSRAGAVILDNPRPARDLGILGTQLNPKPKKRAKELWLADEAGPRTAENKAAREGEPELAHAIRRDAMIRQVRAQSRGTAQARRKPQR